MKTLTAILLSLTLAGSSLALTTNYPVVTFSSVPAQNLVSNQDAIVLMHWTGSNYISRRMPILGLTNLFDSTSNVLISRSFVGGTAQNVDLSGSTNTMVSIPSDLYQVINGIAAQNIAAAAAEAATNPFPQLNTNSVIVGTGQWHGGTPGSFLIMPGWSNANANIIFWFQATNLPPGGLSINGSNWFQIATDGHMKFLAGFDPAIGIDVMRYGFYFNPTTWGHFASGGASLDADSEIAAASLGTHTGYYTHWLYRAVDDTNGFLTLHSGNNPPYDAYGAEQKGYSNTWAMAIYGNYAGGSSSGDNDDKSPYAVRFGVGTTNGTIGNWIIGLWQGNGTDTTSPANPGQPIMQWDMLDQPSWSVTYPALNTNEGDLYVKGTISGYGSSRTAESSFDGCVFDCPFVEGMGTNYHTFGFYATTGSGYTTSLGTATNHLSWTNAQSGYGVLVQSNASSSQINFPQVPLGGSSNWTLECVFYQPALGDSVYDWPISVSANQSPGSGGAGIYIRDNGGNVLDGYFHSASGTDYNVTATVTGILGAWHQIALTYDGATLTLYVDGASVGTAAASGALPPLTTGNAIVGDLQDGVINCARMFNRTLNANDIKLHYDEYFAP